MRLYAISDIHTDYKENKSWLSNLSTVDFSEDILILAGDISDSMGEIEFCFDILSSRFAEVFYVPGNHELWVNRCKSSTSIVKFEKILELAHSYKVHTSPKDIGRINIVPLFSWYDYSFGRPSPSLISNWMDFFNCRWPKELSKDKDISIYFHKLNSEHLTPSDLCTVSFSHFLPSLDLMPSFIPAKYRLIYPVLGSDILDEQVSQLGSTIHIYGHSHVNRDINRNGVRFINSAFGYPSERRITKKTLKLVIEDF